MEALIVCWLCTVGPRSRRLPEEENDDEQEEEGGPERPASNLPPVKPSNARMETAAGDGAKGRMKMAGSIADNKKGTLV